MANGFNPLGFEGPNADQVELMRQLDLAAELATQLEQLPVSAIIDLVDGVSKETTRLSRKIAKPIAKALEQSNEIVNTLGNQVASDITTQIASASELQQQLESVIRISGEPKVIGGPEDIAETEIIGGPEDTINGNDGDDVIIDIPPGDTINGEDGDDEIAIDEPPNGEETNGGNGGGGGGGNGNGGNGNGGQEDGNGGEEEQPEETICPPGTVSDGQGGCFPFQCPPGTVFNAATQQCEPEIVPTACPAPIVACPDPPDINVVVNVPRPGEEEEEEQPDPGGVVLPGPIGPGGARTFCRIDTYDTGEEFEVVPDGLNANTPFASLFFGPGFSINRYILEQDQIANSRGGVFPLKQIGAAIKRNWGIFVRRLDQAATAFVSSAGCTNPIFLGSEVMRGVLSFIGIFAAGATSRFQQILFYRSNAFCPVEFPDHNEATEAFVRGTIDKETYDLWVQQNNKCLDPWERMTEARTDRVEPLMALQMWKREFLTEEEFDQQIRKNGYLSETFQNAFKSLANFIPPITDLVRFMVRDVEDTAIVERFKMDEDFDAKWAGEVKEWGTQQGISEDVAKRYWRAHWRIPSPTQLFDMFHRSRHLPDDDPLKTSRDDVRTALKQDDLLPAWIDRMINRTFAIPTRRDARRQFETGSITADQLKQVYTMAGYTDSDADDIVRWATINKTQVLLNQPMVRLFRDGVISEGELREHLERTKLDLAEQNQIVMIAEKQGSRRFVNRCVNAIRKRFLTGELSIEEAQAEAVRFGLNITQSNAFAGNLLCEQGAVGKHPPTTMLCNWLELGVIQPPEFVSRLERIGWTNADALRILVSCQSKIGAKRAREAKKLAQEEQRAMEKEQRQLEAERRKIQRAQANAERQRERLVRAKKNRDKLMQRAVARFAKDVKIDVDLAAACILGLERRMALDLQLTIDERIQTIVVGVEKTKPTDCEDLVSKVNQLADQLLEFGEITEDFLEQMITV